MDVVTPTIRSTALRPRCSLLAWVLVCGSACRPTTSPAPPEPASSPTPAVPTKVQAPRVRGPEELVVVVDGEAIREADVARLAVVTSAGPDRIPREALVLQLVERRLVTHAAARLDVTTTEEEIDRALEGLAAANGMTLEQLRVAVGESTKLSWAEYREEVAAQLRELRLVMISQPRASAAGFGAPEGATEASQAQHIETARARMLGCLRARADVSVKDEAVELPENPFAIAATLAGVRFVGDPKVPAMELEAAAKAAAASRPLCDSLAAAEMAMTELYRERGFLDAQVSIPWPKAPGTTIVEVEAVPGARHVIGEVDVDQSAAPKAKRVKEKELRRRIAAIAETGEVAGISKLRGIVDVVEGALRDAGLGPVDVQAERKAGGAGEDVRVDLAIRVRASGA